jgi:predicted ATP-grasp superfamily ATP-dependent carboligase
MSPAGALTVGVVGASARAAVGSLLRAGFAAWAVDLFADRDLRRMAPCVRCPSDDYPEALPRLADAFPPGPVLYTGGLENRPDVVRDLAARRPLWGNSPEVLEKVRDPFRNHTLLSLTGFPVPQVRPPQTTPPPGHWLLKPIRTAGGHGIRFATETERPRPDCYLQEFIDGRAMSALLATRNVFDTLLLGVTEQLVGEPWLHARPFGYAGNIGPFPIGPDLGESLGLLATATAAASDLRGLWGIDFILRDGCPYPVEVNPRYTAAVEVLELGRRARYLPQHAKTFSDIPPWRPNLPARPRVVGKAIYYAPHRIAFPPAGPWDADLAGEFDPWRLPAFADIPEPGEVIEPGWPVLTFFAEGSTADECRSRLQSTAAELDRLFGAAEPTP